MKNILLGTVLTIILSGCAHHNDVRPTESGNHYVIVKSAEKSLGFEEALSQARHYCEKQKSSLVVLKEEQQYQGEQDEASFIAQRKTADVVEGIGTMMWIFGDGRVDDAGAVMSLGGAIAEESLGQPYITNISFKCLN